MRKLITLIFLSVIGCGLVKAQPRCVFGPKAGVNFSKMAHSPEASSKNGFTGGWFYIYMLREHWGISTDVVYAAKGGAYRVPMVREDIPAVESRDLRLHYVEAPILVNYFFRKRGKLLRPKLTLGPTVSYLGAATERGVEVRSTLNQYDVGITGGIGANMYIGARCWLNVDARYTRGFMDVSVDEIGAPVYNSNLALSIGLGFCFRDTR